MLRIARIAKSAGACGVVMASMACGSATAGHTTEIHPPGTAASPTRTIAAVGTWKAVVNVSVATLWTRPAALRPLDAPSATNPVNIPLWLSRMTTADRAWLVGRLQTQVLYGSAVSVLRRSGRWSFVAVPGQPTHRGPGGTSRRRAGAPSGWPLVAGAVLTSVSVGKAFGQPVFAEGALYVASESRGLFAFAP